MNNNDITFCLIWCGETTKAECYRRIEPYLARGFAYNEIINVRPQFVALNSMISQCNTPYLVPLDADFLIKDGAIERMLHAIESHGNDPYWHSILFSVYDTQYDIVGRSFKVFRTQVVKAVPYQNVRDADRIHFQDLKTQGYHAIDLTHEPPIADHVVEGNYHSYMRSKHIFLCNFVGTGHSRELPLLQMDRARFIFDKLIQRDREDNKYAIMGIYDGLIGSSEQSKSMDEIMVRTMADYPQILYKLQSILYNKPLL